MEIIFLLILIQNPELLMKIVSPICAYVCQTETVVLLHQKHESPNSSYLHFGSIPRSWDTNILSSHIHKAGQEILRARDDCKCDETQGLLPTEHMNIFAQTKLCTQKGSVLHPKGKLLGTFGAWGGTFQKSPPWILEPHLEL